MAAAHPARAAIKWESSMPCAEQIWCVYVRCLTRACAPPCCTAAQFQAQSGRPPAQERHSRGATSREQQRSSPVCHCAGKRRSAARSQRSAPRPRPYRKRTAEGGPTWWYTPCLKCTTPGGRECSGRQPNSLNSGCEQPAMSISSSLPLNSRRNHFCRRGEGVQQSRNAQLGKRQRGTIGSRALRRGG